MAEFIISLIRDLTDAECDLLRGEGMLARYPGLGDGEALPVVTVEADTAEQARTLAIELLDLGADDAAAMHVRRRESDDWRRGS